MLLHDYELRLMRKSFLFLLINNNYGCVDSKIVSIKIGDSFYVKGRDN